MSRGVEEIQTSVERILQSGAFRNAPSSRRLLKYLADHSQAGDSDQLKEYTVGIDAFNKPEGYDPRQDSTVRIQMGRLRQKLSEYYRDEGKDDSVIVDIPKGRFGLVCGPRPAGGAPLAIVDETPELAAEVAAAPANHLWRNLALALGAACLALAGLAGWLALRSPAADVGRVADAAAWSADLEELWSPVLHSGRPLRIVVGNPLFVQFENKALYRDLSTENAEDLLKSPNLAAIAKALGSHESRTVHYYAAVGDVYAAFWLGQRLGPRQPGISMVRSSQLQWQQLADANVLFLGPPRFFGEKMGSLPIPLEVITVGTEGFQIVHPQNGEPGFYKFREPAGFLAEDGEAHVLVTHAPGPVGSTDVISFEGNSTFGRMGAIEAFTNAAFARTLVRKMRNASGRIPQYFQVLLKVKYKGGVPTDTVFVLGRELKRRG